MSKSRLIVFDIDGTLADSEWRLPHIKKDKPDWPSFFAEAVFDKPIPQVYYLWNLLSLDKENIMVIATGRSIDSSREVTATWLDKWEIYPEAVYYRAAGDYRQDFEVKTDILNEIVKFYGMKPFLVIDDRKQVVEKTWYANDIYCFDCGQGRADS